MGLLTPADLSHFLRTRQSDLCQIASDFVLDHPDDPAVLKAIDHLEKWADKLAGKDFFCRGNGHFGSVLGINQRGRFLLVLNAIAGRWLGVDKLPPPWYRPGLERAEFWVYKCGYAGGWAAVIVRMLRPKGCDR